jgi:hypothetical protein
MSRSGLELMGRVTRPALMVAPTSFLSDIRAGTAASGLQRCVALSDTPAIFDFLMDLIPFQGVADTIAAGYVRKHGNVGWNDVHRALARSPSCPKLRSHWDFDECHYSKSAQRCSQPRHFGGCPLPLHPLRKGGLNQAAYSLFLFLRDVCADDFVGWIDRRLAAADPGPGAPDRCACLRTAVIEPLRNVHLISDKIASMALSDLLLGGDPDRERWLVAGASMIVIDTLMHNYFLRTGILRAFRAEHAYGHACYGPRGCVSVMEAFAKEIDAREFNPEFPAYFPRFLQHAIWRFCAQSFLDVCNGNRIDDRRRCDNNCCPAYDDCRRVALHAATVAGAPLRPRDAPNDLRHSVSRRLAD